MKMSCSQDDIVFLSKCVFLDVGKEQLGFSAVDQTICYETS